MIVCGKVQGSRVWLQQWKWWQTLGGIGSGDIGDNVGGGVLVVVCVVAMTVTAVG